VYLRSFYKWGGKARERKTQHDRAQNSVNSTLRRVVFLIS
jgi:hypothetical protein